MKTIEIQSTKIGMMPSLLNAFIWIIIPIICFVALFPHHSEWSKHEIHGLLINVGLVIAYIIFAIVILLCFCDFLKTAIYGPTNTMILYLDDKGKITKITDTYFKFVNAKYHDEIICSRVLSVEVYTPTLGSILNTGTLTINFVSFANADYKEESRVIHGVEFPDNVKKQIMEASAVHDGLKISS